MHTVNTLHRTLGLSCLSLLLIFGMGCNKMLAQYNVNSATKRVTQAKALNVEKLLPTELGKTQGTINTAQNQINSQDYKSAVTTSKEASLSSKELLQRTKELRAAELRDEASKWLKIATINQASQLNPQRFPLCNENNDKGLKYMEKASYDRAIKTFGSVVTEVQYILKNLADEAAAGHKETEAMKEELIKEGAPQYAPQYVNDITQSIAQIKKLVEDEKNYREALVMRDRAKQNKTEGIIRTKDAKSKEMLGEIENLLDTANVLEAAIYALQNFKLCSKQYSDLLQQYYDRNYDTVLVSAPVLKPKVVDLIVETKRESANAKAKEVEKAINNLDSGKARTYLPGRVEQLETLLAQARQNFDQKTEKGYEESKKISERGLELNQVILQEFNTLTEQEIAKAGDVLSIGENVYRTMQDIFDKKIAGASAPEDQRLEDAKQAMKEELRVKLQSARNSLELASVNRQEKDFDLAIETAKQVAQTADDVQQQTYRVVAHNAILEIANELTRLEREGGRQYASAETDKTLKLLEVSKTLLHGNQYRDAVKQAADTRAQLAILTQELGRVAVRKIDDATRALEAAKASKAEKYENDTFNQSAVAMDRAKLALEGAGLQQAIELANQAQQLADSASEKSRQQWAMEEIKRADELLGKAKAAGSAQYAPEKLQKAIDMRATLQSLYDQASYKQAIEVGEQAVEAADAAFYAKVVEAENEIATARRYDGWEQEHERLAAAIISARNARECMDAAKYDIGLQHAQGAIVQAQVVAKNAKRKSFETRMAALQKHMETAQRDGAGYYQAKDLAKVLSDMNRLRNEFDNTSYEDLTQGVETLESRLAGVMEMTPDVLKELVETMQNRLAELEGRHARSFMATEVTEVERKIHFAQLDFKAEKFRSSYQNAKDASNLMDAITTHLDERDFDFALNNQLKAYSRQIERFSGVLGIGSPTMIEMASGPQGRSNAIAIMNACSPSDLLTQINEIGVKVEKLNTPPSRRQVREATIRMLALARTAAQNFEKMLILDQYSKQDAKDIIETAFLQMYQARTQQQDIQRAIKYPLSDLQPRGVERVVTYHGD